ncbi:MAG: ribosomal RNA small subunit methyltransferase A [Phycisphaerae bacterium]|nr:ribosomal RNA small subunit methyltransferase A [Phycisphaerae bacterium]
MQTLAQIRAILEAAGARPKRSLGQNFLIDHNMLRRLADASGVGPGSLVVEVGPGTGTLTEELLARGCEVIACELDDALAATLEARRAGMPSGERLRVVHADCLADKRTLGRALDAELRGRAFALVANLPYGAATPLLMTLMGSHPECGVMAVTVQREAADRLTAGPGSKAFGPLGVLASAVCEIRVIGRLGPECFWPRPDVDSAMVVLRRRERAGHTDPRRLADFAQLLFAHRRKQLGWVLDRIEWPELGVRPGDGRGLTLPDGVSRSWRAEALSVAQIAALCDQITTRTG